MTRPIPLLLLEQKRQQRHPVAGGKPSPVGVALLASGLVILGLCLHASATVPSSDFLTFYTGATRAARGEAAHAEAVKQLEQRYGRFYRSKPFHRLPFYSLAISPLASMPYERAFVLWQAVNVVALACFLWFWPFRYRLRAVVLSLWFLPLWIAIDWAQDSAILLACIALAARLLQRNRHFIAGVVLAICCFKANLLLAIPIVLVARRMWQVCAGLAAGGSALYIISALTAGVAWPLDYLATLQRTTQVLPTQTYFATITGLAQSLPEPSRWIRWPAMFIVVCLLALISRRIPFDRVLGLALMAGLLISPFAFLYDAAAMLPGIIGAMDHSRPSIGVLPIALGMAMITIVDPRIAWVGQSCLILIFSGAIWAAFRHARLANPEPT